MNHAVQVTGQHPALTFGNTFEIRPVGDMDEIIKAVNRDGDGSMHPEYGPSCPSQIGKAAFFRSANCQLLPQGESLIEPGSGLLR